MQTSIEWFIEHLLGNGLLRLTKDDHNLYSKLRDEAKEMHKNETENLYTEEQVIKLMYWTSKMTLGVWHSFKSEAKIIDELESKIQSLKQPKKD
jgi:hypothetical protein